MEDHSYLAEFVFRALMQRHPTEKEIEYWSPKFSGSDEAIDAIKTLIRSGEHQNIIKNMPGHVPGHYYSPVNNVSSIDRNKLALARANKSHLPGINVSEERILDTWNSIRAAVAEYVLPIEKSEGSRYYTSNPTYGPGDGIVLTGMVGHLKPRQIIEIGSGFSSACMLDAADRYNLDTKFTFIEPYPDRLYATLTGDDRRKCTIIEKPVQDTALSTFKELTRDDVLFIDSTHVLKCQSDVNFELFNILPALQSGVVIHFHDIFWPFDYPADWIFGAKYTWNEAYAVRAFLMDNDKYEVIFFNDYFARHMQQHLNTPQSQSTVEQFRKNPGGGLWLRKK